MDQKLYVMEVDTNYSEIPVGYIEQDFAGFVSKNLLEVIERNSQVAIVRAEWGNGEGFDTFEIRFIDDVMTAGEIVKCYGLDESTVRQAIRRGLPARKSGGTWLVLRSVAEARWGSRAKSAATMLVTAIWLTAAIWGMTL